MTKYRIVENELGEFRVEKRWLFGWLAMTYWADLDCAKRHIKRLSLEPKRNTIKRIIDVE